MSNELIMYISQFTLLIVFAMIMSRTMNAYAVLSDDYIKLNMHFMNQCAKRITAKLDMFPADHQLQELNKEIKETVDTVKTILQSHDKK